MKLRKVAFWINPCEGEKGIKDESEMHTKEEKLNWIKVAES